MSVKPQRVQFNGGELSPWLEGRTDIAKFDKTARLCRNFIPLAEGALKRRGGTHFVAMTPENAGARLTIETYPVDAKVVINGNECRSILVAFGDKVSFEVSAEGYTSQRGTVLVSKDMTLDVRLVSCLETCRIEIVSVPQDAVVKIEGVARRIYDAPKNSIVNYIVYADGYVLCSDAVMADKDKVITVNLVAYEEDAGAYEEWGEPVGFVACTAAGSITPQLKCFCFRFTQGYMAVLFDANLEAPTAQDKPMFFHSGYDEYNTVALKKGEYKILKLRDTEAGVYYEDSQGACFYAVDKLITMKIVGWQIDEVGQYATFYKSYDGVVSGNVLQVYRNGKKVWEMKGKNNNG